MTGSNTLLQHPVNEIKKDCSEDCGLGLGHKQHTCLGIVEITDACNLSCPVCPANAKGNNFLSLEQVSDMMDLYVKAEGNPDVLQISGGEPTLHPKLLEILILAKLKGINIVQLYTNGLRIAQDDMLLKELALVKPALYLQFDGFTPEIYQKIRGADLLDIKMKAIERLTEKGVSIVLSVTVVKGVNDHQVGDITRFASEHPGIRGVLFHEGIVKKMTMIVKRM
ncbi:radical SAM protein [Desulfosporosinus metallidurans]|uniref:Molybdopterin-based tungsten cofactor biosynthesis protein n=1 Tax=Desulfosporosinus metallidurans TaxID=1888891 RepID=A0A1Q8QI73_9FIRM|nr:radical SAM protein [Desulfosporosinus metallidurans]OLN27053.1 molybdopterin-based tungsten cofactor biosynthesis protein [Desulfosporosinus metallidurans]